ncbi:phosphomevalonate kinase [Agrilus planipennis]|uniref:Phosphomevalonate kinase n=1 Tax=Agrilus planipennis TaxID=224129 RepID=A0A1W4X2P2_AGRPL|nr:phosphomevalonate kinase [Agrilus planipennis]XP_018330389.1 phosphomevalonate kinase [Agrilus planipennis]XP_018330396.1 phosphomevalonate kinase [Agrilus planipennis]XP_018330404.1 phosphomevalonate kinase [Agrilus planipennis]
MASIKDLQIILLLSGKRKSGKDYISAKLTGLLNDTCTLIRISGPLKKKYADINNLNYEELLTDNGYKETYRKQMIIWSDEIRKTDPGYFCKVACEEAIPKKIWIVSDIRRKTDINWFQSNYGKMVKKVRIIADDDVRKQRGWKFTKGVDDAESECDLDDYNDWDLIISNNNSSDFENGIGKILTLINESIQG